MSVSLVDASPRTLGTDLAVGPLGYGCWRFGGTDVTTARGKIETALACGMDLVDTADVYGLDDGLAFGAAEALLGEVLAEAPALRDRMVLATKGGIVPGVPYDSSARYLRSACEASLARLRVDTVDLYQIHRPDLFAHPAQVAEVLTALHDEGKVRAVGVSNHTANQFDALQAHLDLPIVTHQPELSVWELASLDDGVLDQCVARAVTPLAWSPLAGGRLVSGEGLDDTDADRGPRVLAALDALAEREGVDRAAVALAFVLAHPSRPVALVGSQRPERIRAAVAALDVTLDRVDVYGLVAASGRPLP